MISRHLIALVIITLASSQVLAQEADSHQHGTHSECPLPKNAMDVVRCAMNEHPISKRAQLNFEASRSLVDAANQIPNPEIDLESTYGSGERSGDSGTDVGILFPLEWGGRRGSRLQLAEGQIASAKADAFDVQAEVILETVRNLHRLRQIELEKSVLKDTVSTLQKIVSEQSSRAALTPEQQVSLSVYRMAVADAKLKQTEIFEEERKIEHFFHVSTGHSLAELIPVLPPSPKQWPNLSPLSENEVSPTLAKAFGELSLSQAELSAASSQAWPQLRLGPMARLDRVGNESENQYGFRLMMDIPVFNLNGGNKTHALNVVKKSEAIVELVRKEESHERAEQFKVYNNSVEALKESPTLMIINKDFDKNQGLARRGLISGALLIELHRQRNELIKSLNARELSAIQAQWLIYKLDGRIFKESL